MYYLNKIKILLNLLNLSLNKSLTSLFCTIMYLLLFINYYKVFCINILYSINTLLTYILYLLKYHYIKIKFFVIILVNKYNNFFSKKTNNWKYFFLVKSINWKIPLIVFPSISMKNLKLILNCINLISQLLLVFVIVFFCYNVEFILLTFWQSLNMSYSIIGLLETLTIFILFLINSTQLDFGYFNELTLFVVPEYYLNLPGYLAFKHSLLFPVVEFYTQQIEYYRNLAITITDTWNWWAFESGRWLYYWNLIPAVINKPEIAVIFKSTLFISCAETINFTSLFLILEVASRLYFTTNFLALFNLWYLLLELSNTVEWWFTLLIDIICNLNNIGSLIVGLSAKCFISCKVAVIESLAYCVICIFFSLIRVFIITLEGATYLLISYSTWLYYPIFVVGQISLGWGLVNFGLTSNIVLNFDLSIYTLFWYYWGFWAQTCKILIGHCFYAFNYPIFTGFALVCVLVKWVLNVLTIIILNVWLCVGVSVLTSFHAVIVICGNTFLEVLLFTPLFYVKYAITYFEGIFSVLFFFFNSDFFFFNCSVDALLWFGIWMYCVVWLGAIYLYLYARLVEHGYWWQVINSRSLAFDLWKKSKVFGAWHVDFVVAGCVNFKLTRNRSVNQSSSFVARNSFRAALRPVCEIHYTWLKCSIKTCLVKSIFIPRIMSNSLVNRGFGAGLKFYHDILQFFLFTRDRVALDLASKDKLSENMFLSFFLSFPWLIVTSTFDMLFWFNSSELWLAQMRKIPLISHKNFYANYLDLDFSYRAIAVSPLSTASSTLQFNDSFVETSQIIHKYLKFSSDSEVNVTRIGRKNFWETSNRNFVFQSRYLQLLQFGTFWNWAYLRAQEFERYFENQDASADDPMELFASGSWYTSPIIVNWSKNIGRSVWFAFLLPMIGNFSPMFDILFTFGGRDFERRFFSDVAVVQEVKKTTNLSLEFDLSELFINHKILQIREFIDYYIYWKALGNIYLKYAEPRASFVANFFKSFEDLHSFPSSYTSFTEHPYTYNGTMVETNHQRLVTVNLLKFGRLKRQAIDYWLNRPELNKFTSYWTYSEPLYKSLNTFNTNDICLLPRRLNVFWRRSMFTTFDFVAGNSFGNWGATNVLYETFYSQFYYKYIAMKQSYSFAFIEYDRIQFFKKIKFTAEEPDFVSFTRDAWAKKKFHPSASQKWNLDVMLFFNKLKYLTVRAEALFFDASYFYWTLNGAANFLAGNQIFDLLDWFLRTMFYTITKFYYSLTAFYAPPISHNSLIAFNLKNFMFRFNALVDYEASLMTRAPNAYLFVTPSDSFTFSSPWVGRVTLSSV